MNGTTAELKCPKCGSVKITGINNFFNTAINYHCPDCGYEWTEQRIGINLGINIERLEKSSWFKCGCGSKLFARIICEEYKSELSKGTIENPIEIWECMDCGATYIVSYKIDNWEYVGDVTDRTKREKKKMKNENILHPDSCEWIKKRLMTRVTEAVNGVENIKYEYAYSMYKTECGHETEFMDKGDIKSNDFVYCPYCGGKIQEMKAGE